MFGPLVPVYFAMDNFLRVCGKPRLSMIINISTQVINVGLNFVLIVLLHQGVRAAAAASCISIVLGMITFEISDSLQPAISYCYGAKATERLKELFRIILTVTAVLSAGVFLLMFLARPLRKDLNI